MKAKGVDIDGWLVIDKPLNVTSTQVVGKMRRLFNAKKAGHGGTLDPLATGLLPIAFGQATKTVSYVMDAVKHYRFTLKMGEARSTDDAEGEVIETSDARPSSEHIKKALENFQGLIMQTPPVFSALKVEGKRAYDLARSGTTVDLKPRPARIDYFALIERPDRDTAIFEVRSGKGVYMRALGRDLARACGTVGYLSALRRTKIGPFFEKDAISLDKILINDAKAPISSLLYPVATALADIPALALTTEEATRLAYGQSLPVSALKGRMPDAIQTIVQAMDGEKVVGLCRLENGLLRPNRIL